MRRRLALLGAQRRWLAGCLVGLCGLMVAMLVWGRNERGMAVAQMPAPPAPTVVVAEVLQKTVPLSEEYVARTEAVQTVELRARVEGFLEHVSFQEGSLVKEGQVLFVIERRPYEAALQAAKAQLAKAQADLTQAQEQVGVLNARATLAQRQANLAKARQDVERFRPLARDRAVPQQDLDTAVTTEQAAVAAVRAAEATLKDAELQHRIGILQGQAAVEAGKAAVIQAELHLSYTTIRAPVTGIIGFLAVHKGNLVGPSQHPVLATMSSVDPMKVTFGVSEVQYLRFAKRTGMTTSDQPPDFPFELLLADESIHPYKGKAAGLDRAVDTQTGTVQVQVYFPNPTSLLRPGQFGRIRVAAEELPDAVLVPQTAVQELQGTQTVVVVDQDNKTAVRPVRLGSRFERYYVVLHGLAPGERVIVEGQHKVRPGMTVMPTLLPASRDNTADEQKGGR